MKTIEEKAYAKINLGLDIISKRDDGYHEVNMVMHSINLYDILIFSENEDGKRLYTGGNDILKMGQDNLVCKAAELFCKNYNIKQGFKIELKKVIPMAAGLAGGSSDAAAVLRGLNRLFKVDASDDELRVLGKEIGADVPYCVIGGTALAQGIGEKLSKIPSPQKKAYLVAKPMVSVSTKWAYDEIDNAKELTHPDIEGLVKALRDNNNEEMYLKMGNVFENVIMEKYPIVGVFKAVMEECGAKKALMSGSGPTVFGIFDDSEALNKAAEKINLLEHECIYKIW